MVAAIKNNSLFLLILCVGCILRFYQFSEWSLTNDELSALSRLQFDNLKSVVENGVRLDDMHPMGVQVFLWFWIKMFGMSAFAIRLPFVIIGCFTLIVIYSIAKFWLGNSRALIVLAIISCSEFPILYSQLARPYAPGLFFSMLFVWSWTKYFFQNEKPVTFSIWNIILIIAGAGAMYTHYFSFMFVGLVGVAGLFFVKNKKQGLFYLLSGIIMFILYIPSFPVMFTHFSVGGLGGDGGWLGVPSNWAILEFLYYCFNNDWEIIIGLVVLIIFSLFLTKFKIIINGKVFLLFILGVLPVLVAYYYSIFKNPVFQYSILIFGYPLIIIGIVSLIKLQNEKHVIPAVGLVLGLFMFSTVFSKKHYSTEQFAVFKNIAFDIESYSNELNRNNIEYTVNVIKPFYLNYYLHDSLLRNNIVQYCCNKNDDYLVVDSILANSSKKYFLHAWSNNYHAPELEFRIKKYFPYLVKQDIHFNSGIYVFSKDSSKHLKNTNVLFYEKNDFEKNNWNVDNKLLQQRNDALSGSHISILDSTLEYGITYTNSLQQIQLTKGRSLVVELNVKSVQIPKHDQLMLVVEIDSPSGQIKSWRSLQFQPFIKEKNKWTTLFYGYKYVEDMNADDIIKIYLYNPGKYSAAIDDLIIRVVN
ncbi:MAG: glycosyltransferase family 39 protein [Bacteroidota bacterium]